MDVNLNAMGAGAPSMLFKYVTPPVGYSIPRSVQYNYNEINRYINPVQAGITYNKNWWYNFE